MNKIIIYCGWLRNTKIKIRPKLINNIVAEIQCLECKGTGIWSYGYSGNETCIDCKGTGIQYVGI